mgnify:CR=1 FL=1
MFIIVVRMPSGNLWAIMDEDLENVQEWETYEEARKLIKAHILEPFPWQILEIEV